MAFLEISQRFCGPPGAANGGYLAGRLATIVGGPSEVTFRRPTPLERPVRVDSIAGRIVLVDRDLVTAEAAPIDLEIDVPRRVSWIEAEAAARAFPRFVDHPVPRCFVCGVERAPGDGLRIFPGPFPGREHIYAAPWSPDASLGDESGFVRPELLWAALDCTGAFAVNEPPRGLALLGKLAARIDRRVHVGEPLVVIGWPIAGEGRKLRAGTAIFTAAGETVAVARATWVLTSVK